MGVQEQQGRGKYLGLPGYVGRRKREILGFVKDRLRAGIMGWGNRFLSRGGREVLLKTVLQSVPNYAMNVFLLPKGLCRELETLMNSFWWGCERREGRGIRWSTWESLCKPKKFGGMGFRRVRDMNLAMLGKQGWKFLTHPDALVTKVFKARYFPNGSFLEAKRGSNPSFVWASIWEAQGLLSEGVQWRIGDGRTVRVWGVPWLPDRNNPYVSTPQPSYLNNPQVSSLLYPGSYNWDLDLLRDLFCKRDVEQIMSIPIPSLGVDDSLFWKCEEKGVYTVRSGYRLVSGGDMRERGVDWASLWVLNIPPKVKCFFWTLCTLRLPTKDALHVKHVVCDPICPLCGVANETAVHLFANCLFAHTCWQILNMSWSLNYVDSIGLWMRRCGRPCQNI